MSNKKKRYIIPRISQIVEITKVAVLLKTCFQQVLTETLTTHTSPFKTAKLLKESHELVFDIPGRDGTAVLDEVVEFFLDGLEEFVNDNMESLEIAWRVNGFFDRKDSYDDDEDDDHNIEMIKFDEFLDVDPSDDGKVLRFLMLMELISGASMYERYNEALEDALGQDIKNTPPQPIRYFSDNPIDRFLEDTIENLTRSTKHTALCQIISNFAVASLDPNVIGDSDEEKFIANWIVNSIYCAPLYSDHGLFTKVDETHIVIDENSVVKLKILIVSIIGEAYTNASAILNIANPDILCRVNPFTFLPVVKMDDPYMGMYVFKPRGLLLYDSCDETVRIYRRDVFAPIIGLYQYIYVITDSLSNQEKRKIWDELCLLVADDTLDYQVNGLVALLWEDIAVSMNEFGKSVQDRLEYSPKFLCSNNSKIVAPLLSRYSLVSNAAFPRNSVKYISCAIPPSKCYIHHDVYRIIDLLTMITRTGLNVPDTYTMERVFNGSILLYNVLYMSLDLKIDLNQLDINNLIDFCFTSMRHRRSGRQLQLRILGLIDKIKGINRFIPDDGQSEVYALYMAGAYRKDFINLLVWLSKTTVYKASAILSWLMEQETVNIDELLNTSIDDMFVKMLVS